MQESSLQLDIRYTFLHNNERKPILELTAKRDSSTIVPGNLNYVIRLIPELDMDSLPFSPRKLLPDKNNIRSSGSDQATPSYNNAILTEMCGTTISNFQSKTSQIVSNHSKACTLLKAWARSNVPSPQDEIGFFLSIILVYLLQGKTAIPHGGSSLQLFRATLDFISKTLIF